GYFFKGYVSLGVQKGESGIQNLAYKGSIDTLPTVVEEEKIEEIIIALEKSDSHRIGDVVEKCSQTAATIKIVPGIYDYIIGSVKSSHILGAPLIEIFPQLMRPWEQVGKRVFDLAVSITALAILIPIYAMLTIAIKLDSEGPVLYFQERIGKDGKPFKIIKFRSMYIDAEKFGPALSKEKDPRITKVGLFLRKLRLDELPQFWNVLVGDMSIVGPRPERQFYIDQIVKIAPHYRHLHKIKPGITSWGQVKYGYASNVGEMVERLKYDILYMEQMSLALDIKIILYTFLVIIEGRGK
ncbi:MAG: sugar transferase, partial [Bacteroidota bacterium]